MAGRKKEMTRERENDRQKETRNVCVVSFEVFSRRLPFVVSSIDYLVISTEISSGFSSVDSSEFSIGSSSRISLEEHSEVSYLPCIIFTFFSLRLFLHRFFRISSLLNFVRSCICFAICIEVSSFESCPVRSFFCRFRTFFFSNVLPKFIRNFFLRS